MKKKIIELLDYLNLLKKYRKHYYNYYCNYKRKIYKELKKVGISDIKPVHRNEWKIWYNCCYFSGYINDNMKEKPVFIKVMGESLKDCFYNEKIVNDYICNNSEYLAERAPKLYANIEVEGYYVLVSDYLNMDTISKDEVLFEETKRAIEEYTEKAVIHTDFAIVNVGQYKNKFYYFDYGTSLCPDSDNIRLRNGKKYNHLDKITDAALSIIEAPDYYYDDAVHFGIEDVDRNSINFIVGKGEEYYAKLGNEIYKYKIRLKPMSKNVYLLCKCNES